MTRTILMLALFAAALVAIALGAEWRFSALDAQHSEAKP